MTCENVVVKGQSLGKQERKDTMRVQLALVVVVEEE
jgi:hypothetical protein